MAEQELIYLHCHRAEQQRAEYIAAFVADLLNEFVTIHKRLLYKLALRSQEGRLRG